MNKKYLILIIEDNDDISRTLTMMLKNEGYEVSQAFSGTEGRLLLKEKPDLILLDLMLPGMSGEKLLSEIRTESDVPVVVMSGKAALENKLEVLDSGADDYLVKPFEYPELLARVKVALRRSQMYRSHSEGEVEKVAYGDLVLDPNLFEVHCRGELVPLTGMEFQILHFMLTEPEKVYSRDLIYREVWGSDFSGDDNAVNVHVSHLRHKLRECSGVEWIETVWGIGYRLCQLE